MNNNKMGDIKLSIYAISDLHLALGTNKPMDIFGESWNNHLTKIELDWKSKAKVDDVILLPGDLSWAMNIKETYLDFKYLNNLPGKKILLKGNHDYWWTTVTSMKRYMLENKFENINFLYNNSYQYEDYIICGTRGWNNTESTEDEKIYKREQQRLKLSIEDGIRKYGRERKIIVCMHCAVCQCGGSLPGNAGDKKTVGRRRRGTRVSHHPIFQAGGGDPRTGT